MNKVSVQVTIYRCVDIRLADPDQAIKDYRSCIKSSATMEDVYKQISADPTLELCYYEQKSETQIRLQARAEEVDDDALKNEIIDKFPFLKPWIEQEGLGQMAVCRLADVKALIIVSAGPDEKRETVEL